jgi:transposase-like protein
VHRRLLYKWRDQLEPIEDGAGPPSNSRERELRQQVTQLKRLVADKTLEADFFKGALQKIEARRQSRSDSGETHLRAAPRSDACARQPEYRADVSVG